MLLTIRMVGGGHSYRSSRPRTSTNMALPDGLRTPRPKSVQFNVPRSPERDRRRDRNSGTDTEEDDRVRNAEDASLSSGDQDRKRRRRRRHRDIDSDASEADRGPNTTTDEDDPNYRARDRSRDRDRNTRRARSAETPRPPHARQSSDMSAQSDSTEDLPPRFDEHGNRVRGAGRDGASNDPITGHIEALMSGRASAGDIIRRLAGDLLGGGGGGGGSAGAESEGSGSGRRRRRDR